MTSEPDYLSGNIATWQRNAADYVAPAEHAWASEVPYWGIWRISETELNLLPQDMSDLHCIELGCGTGYVSAWMARRGATVTGIDPTPNQLATARRLRQQYKLDITFEEGFAESLVWPDGSFDFAISEYGAALWADPYTWIPEASRVLRRGGQLVFLSNSPFVAMCAPEVESEGTVTDRLLRPYFGLYKIQWSDAPDATEFHLTHSDWIALFRANDLAVERLIELKPPANAETSYSWANLDWAQKWPTEDVWILRRT